MTGREHGRLIPAESETIPAGGSETVPGTKRKQPTDYPREPYITMGDLALYRHRRWAKRTETKNSKDRSSKLVRTKRPQGRNVAIFELKVPTEPSEPTTQLRRYDPSQRKKWAKGPFPALTNSSETPVSARDDARKPSTAKRRRWLATQPMDAT